MDNPTIPKRPVGRPRKNPKPETTVETVTTEIVSKPKQKRNRPDLANFGQEHIQPGDNSRFVRHALATLNQPPIDIANPQQVEERIIWYFGHCMDNDMKPTVMGMCNALGISRNTLRTWYNEEFRATTHAPIVQKAYALLEELWEDYMLNGKINPVSGIFIGKNAWHYTDKQEVVLTPNHQIDATDVASIEAKYAELPD